MAYTKTTWVNGTTPALNATNLNKIETGIFNADALASQVNSDLGDLEGELNSLITQLTYRPALLIATGQFIIDGPNYLPMTRALFRLSASVSNTTITLRISDGGTDKTIKDVDGANVTTLSKGFHEVVEESDRFVLVF